MKPLISATLAMCLLAVQTPLAPMARANDAVIVPPNLEVQENRAASAAPQTSGGEKDNPAPHIYRTGEHLMRIYGEYHEVKDWAQFKLKKPPEGSHWVRYGSDFLLVKDDTGQIAEIIKGS